MPDLGPLLGQPAVAAQLLSDLQREGPHLVRLTGPGGSGKSYIAETVAQRWIDDGGRCLWAVGDDHHSTRELYPFLSGLAWAPAGWSGAARKATVATTTVADAAGGGGAFASIFELLSGFFRQKTDRALLPYSLPERDVILDLRRLATRRRLLLVADNAHWWDKDSLLLLRDLLSDNLRKAIPQLGALVVLQVDTAEEQGVVHPTAFEALASLHPTLVRVPRCTLEQFPHVLRAFGVTRDVPPHILRPLYTATGGHLKVLQQAAAELEATGSTRVTGRLDQDYIAELLHARFESLGPSTAEVSDLLARAAVVGLSFTEKDLKCLAEDKAVAIRGLLAQAEEIGFVDRVNRLTVTFSHEVIRAAILDRRSASELTTLYGRLSECLALLRPADYSARAQAALRAGDEERFRDMVALANVALLRRGNTPEKVVGRVAIQHPDDPLLIAYLQTVAEGYRAVASGAITAVVPAVRTGVAGESRLMAAERNYVAALCAMGLQNESGVAEARTILTAWIPRLDDEVELAMRFHILLQQAQVLSEMFDEARRTEADVEGRLRDWARYDPVGEVLLHIQERRAAAVNVPEVAERRIQAAVDFFERGTADAVRDRLELFRSLTNLAAIKIRLGRVADAFTAASRAEAIALEVPEVVQRVDVLANDLVLAAYRSGRITVGEAIERQELIIESPEGSSDKFIHRCNLASYLMLAGTDERASIELEALGDELQSQELTETYLVYYWSSLQVVAAALRGDLDQARARHAALDPFVAGLSWPAAAYVRRRQRILLEVLRDFERPRDRERADQLILERWPKEVGPAWAYYGRLVLCCELSYWSDS